MKWTLNGSGNPNVTDEELYCYLEALVSWYIHMPGDGGVFRREIDGMRNDGVLNYGTRVAVMENKAMAWLPLMTRRRLLERGSSQNALRSPAFLSSGP